MPNCRNCGIKVGCGCQLVDGLCSACNYAAKKGIMASQVHKRNDVHTCVKEFKSKLPILDSFEKEYISIPVGWWIKEEERNKIIKCIKNWDLICDTSLRNLEPNDYGKGYLQLYKQLNGVDIQLSKEDFINKISNEYWVIEYNNTIIACGKLIIEDKMYSPIARIEDVICDTNYRRNGLSSIIVNHFIQLAKQNKCYKIILNSKINNSSFYNSLGFISDNNEYKIYLNK